MSMYRAFFTGYKQRSTAVDFTPQASYVTTSLPDSVSRHIFSEVGMYAHAVVWTTVHIPHKLPVRQTAI